MKETIFADFERFSPGKIVNITNGITPRRWLHQANPGLSQLITAKLGACWLRDLDCLKNLRPLADDAVFRTEFRAVKRENKQRLAESIEARTKTKVNPDSLFDVHTKRIHEYKRQLLNVLHVITRYNRIREGRAKDIVPRTVIIGGKAAPGYHMAKLIIKLIHGVADVVNHDPVVNDHLRLVFLPNYNVSNAEKIIPACDLSEQISTAGMEASGTGNMKFALNGALIIGTLDGANIEIMEEIGADNIFIFGHSADEVRRLRATGYNSRALASQDPDLQLALRQIGDGTFSPGEPELFRPIVESLLDRGDYFMLCADFRSYVECHERMERAYLDEDEWTRRSILSVARMGKFSSDRAVREYASEIWNVKPLV